MNIPNLLTLARILSIPLLVLLFYLPFAWSMPLAAALFALAAVTDWLDGYLARRWNQSTPFGAFLDPVADKLMVAVALALLIERYEAIWLTLPALVIIGREIVISALREWMAEMGKRGQVAVSWIGKVKTTLQMIALLVLLAFAPGTPLALLGVVTLYVAALLTLWSMFLYLKAAWPHLSSSMR
ncbi:MULTISPECIES: CDP-diacylglycerol--glycerol-3-phosphate 3-phosphatidyltransferase [Halomonas]|uniref:CDP-diacylglycerol--glycerol-3-phosphate 3-phosphatidyltransferase n=1 Tax=Halomonas ventosae TaxID=229007 RepID=A0A4R6GM69_9GAMM|nr:CDP-diacylglycerol--glycerol-3-phosphate 3-phosphatidyltransferase [Halomonas ventosae]TDN96163.1 CDP-diacylglycerol--glycerol-3-phosphate 3-phosphatidyltransferase [Halomonas ventosae]